MNWNRFGEKQPVDYEHVKVQIGKEIFNAMFCHDIEDNPIWVGKGLGDDGIRCQDYDFWEHRFFEN